MRFQPPTKLRLIQPGKRRGKVQGMLARLHHERQKIPQTYLAKAGLDLDVAEHPGAKGMESHRLASRKTIPKHGEGKKKRAPTGENTT